MHFINWGLIDYKEAWDKQRRIVEEVLAVKGTPADKQEIIFCEHPHVYTLGRNGKVNNLLVNENFLKSINASFYQVDRGGDITYHGPGQIVGYPILDLERLHIGLKQYISNVEEVVICTLADYGITAERLDGATGVWIDATTAKARKICAIGVRTSHFVTMHGFAFNINTDLNYYRHINPCGFIDKGVTSLQQELGHEVELHEVENLLQKHFEKIFA